MQKTFDITNQQIELESSGYGLGISPTASRVRGYKGGILVFDTYESLLMKETHHEPVHYIPRDDLNMLLFTPSNYRTFCPFKGNATHWSMTTNEGIIENAAWSYDTPLPEAEEIKGYLAFYEGALDKLCIEDEELDTSATDISNEDDYTLAEWLIRGVWTAKNQMDLTRQLVDRFLAIGIPITRLNVAIRQLHPLIAGESYLWRKNDNKIELQQMRHESVASENYLKSPLKLVTEGLGGIRQKLTPDQTEFDFPIMKSLRDEGATDYVALPLFFSDGNIHNLTLTTDHPDGFSTTHLGQVYEALPLISRIYELNKLKSNTATLLETYLGKSAGNQVLSGLTKRGDGSTTRAVIWICDLRKSTELAFRLDEGKYLSLLNRFFEYMAAAVLENEGEILKFMGDGFLAIFPASNEEEEAKAAQQAIKAAVEVDRDFEREFAKDGLSGFGIGIHLGNVMFGNIGAPERLDFSVIGPAVNVTSRLEELTKSLPSRILVSPDIAAKVERPFDCFPSQVIRGSNLVIDVFSPAEK